MSTTLTTPAPQSTDPSGKRSTARIAGIVVTGLVVAFCGVDAVLHLLNTEMVREATADLRQPSYMPRVEGIVMAIALTLHLVPRTAIIGAVVLTGYFGGAMAVHLSTEQPLFNTVFAFAFGVLVWLGLWLRDPRVRATYA